MKYVIDIAQEIGTNTFKSIFFNAYDDATKCEYAVRRIKEAFEDGGVEPRISIYQDQNIKRYFIEF